MANRFVVINAVLLALLVGYALAESVTMSRMVFTKLRDLDPNSTFLTTIWDISINPTFLALMLMLFVVANVTMIHRGWGPSDWSTSRMWGVGLALSMICFLIMTSSVIVSPMIDYMSTTVKEVEVLAKVLKGLMIVRFLAVVLILVGGILTLKQVSNS